jgi:hypothetical protein
MLFSPPIWSCEMSASGETIWKLQEMCGISEEESREMLEAHGGDVDESLLALIESGRVGVKALNPHKVDFQFFGRAQKLAMERQTQEVEAKLATTMPAELDAKAAEILGYVPDGLAEKAAGFLHGLAGAVRGISERNLGAQTQFQALRDERRRVLAENPCTVKMPPFPALTAGLDEWTGKDVLDSWSGFRAGEEDKISDGLVELEVPRSDENDVKPGPPAAEYAAAYGHFKERLTEVQGAVLKGIFEMYAPLLLKWRTTYPELPELRRVEELRDHVRLLHLQFHPWAMNACAYIGMSFRCSWDEEHGLGVILHKSRVVDVGTRNTAFDGEMDVGAVKIAESGRDSTR